MKFCMGAGRTWTRTLAISDLSASCSLRISASRLPLALVGTMDSTSEPLAAALCWTGGRLA